jgi:D-alanyl-D-alanine carboxypeptidase
MMLRTSRPADGLRVGLCLLAVVTAFTAVASNPAEARGRRHHRGHHHFARAAAYTPPYAAIVVDANTGKVLHDTNADSLRHPASLTKIMTLYLLFEQLEAGKLKLDSRLEVSDHASQQAPSKLGLVPGQTIAVEDAIRAIVTKSANDVAVTVAEAIGGDEDSFARMMTRKARTLGMTRTVYVNASGLPDEDQVTTARDQATLGRAVQDRFPKQYRYFSTPSFVYRGRAIRNHNKLLGRVDGVDGIKTGYTHDSGFNLVTSVHRNGRFIVAVVLGGASGAARDARMRQLVETQMASAATQRTIAKIAESSEVAAAAVKAAPQAHTQRLVRADSVGPVEVANLASEGDASPSPAIARAAAALSHQLQPGATEPISPVKVKTITVKAGNVQTALLSPLTSPAPAATVAPPHFAKNAPAVTVPPAQPMPAVQSTAVYETASAVATPVAATLAAQRQQHPRGPWIIQLGAFPRETEAQDRLREAQAVGKSLLAKADPFTERVTKGSQELYRARFAGFDQPAAEAACKYFKRNDIACMAIKN